MVGVQVIDMLVFKGREELQYCIDHSKQRHHLLSQYIIGREGLTGDVLKLGEAFKGVGLQQGHSRLTAYAARLKADPALAQRAWNEFNKGEGGQRGLGHFEAKRIGGTSVLRPVDEAAFISTNSTAQWGLAAIECLALVGDSLAKG